MAQDIVSVVVPCHNEGSNPTELVVRLKSVFDEQRIDYEIIFVDDSDDQTPYLIEKLIDEDPRVRLVRLTRRFGQNAAIFEGLSRASGKVTIVMDCDLEDPPEVIPDLIKKWEEGADVVVAQRPSRGTGLVYRLFSKLFYFLISRFSEITIPSSVGEFRLIDRRVVDFLNRCREQRRIFRGLSIWAGFPMAVVSIARGVRKSGATKYSFLGSFGAAIDGIFSFSFWPLRLIAISGFALSLIACAVTIGYLIWRLLQPQVFGVGWASLFILGLFSTAVNLLFMGILAEYVARLSEQVRGRPTAIVDYTIGFEQNAEQQSKVRSIR